MLIPKCKLIKKKKKPAGIISMSRISKSSKQVAS
jgi:hypothetical protein